MDKIAKKEKDEQLSKDINKAIVGGYAIQKGSLPVRHSLGKAIVNAKTDISGDELRNIVKDFSKNEKVKVVFTDIKGEVVKANAMHPKYYKRILDHDILPPNIDKNKIKTAIDRKAFSVNLPRNEAAALHELGHVKDYKRANFNKSPKTPLAISAAMKKGTPFLVAAPLASGKVRDRIREVDLGIGAGDKAMNFVEKHPYLSATAIIGGPTLFAESKASGYAIGQLVKKHGLKKGLSKGKLLAPAFGTYLAGAVGRSALMGTGYKINKAYSDKKNREKIASEMNKEAWILKNKERGLYDDSYRELNKLTAKNLDVSKKDMYRAIYREWNNHPAKDKAVNEFMIGNQGLGDRFKQRDTLKQSKGSVKSIDNDIALRIKNLKSQEDINDFIKGASSNSNQLEKVASMEKIAVRKWKKVIGELSESGVSKLKSSGILDHARELKGLNKGSENIAKRYNIKITNNSAGKYSRQAYRRIKKDPFTSKVSEARGLTGKKIKEQLKQNALNSGGFVSSVNENSKKNIVNRGSVDNLTKGLNKATGRNLKTPAEKLDKDYLDALFTRHEVDEVRHASNTFKNKKKFLGYKGHKISLTPVRGGHNSPKVMASESVNVAVAPKGVKEYMNNLRDISGEREGYNLAYGLDYGKSGAINKKLGNKMERVIASQNKPFIKNLMRD